VNARAVESAGPQQIGDYRIVRQIGRGGMGVVYEAEQASLGRRVALKVLPTHALDDPQKTIRFEREARAGAKLHHTNIVPVFGIGQAGETQYYVMQFIDGLGLDAVLRKARKQQGTGNPDGARPKLAQNDTTTAGSDSSQVCLPGGADITGLCKPDRLHWQSVARIGVQLAEALEYAHSQGVMHRDIKPSNLLLDSRGTVWITDFGLAKAWHGESLTPTGDIIGTIRYMAPERFRGKVDPRADIYSLGLTLYELLALRPAFEENDQPRLVQQVMHDEPPGLRTLNPSIPRDLETIVHKAMAREVDERYARAADLAADLQRFLSVQPILARRVGVHERLWRWCRRNPLLAGSLGLAASALLGTAGVSMLLFRNEARSLQVLAREEEQVRLAKENAERALAQSRQLAEERQDLLKQAESERDRADRNYSLAHKAVEDFLIRVTENKRLKEGDFHALRKEFLESALPYYEKFAQQKKDDVKLEADRGLAYLRLGNVCSLLGETKRALGHYRQMEKIFAELCQSHPAAPDYRHQLATSRHRLGAVLGDLGRKAEAESKFRQALVLRRELVKEFPDEPRYRRDLAASHCSLGVVLSHLHRRADAEPEYRKSLALRDRLANDFPQVREYRQDLAASRNHLGTLLRELGRDKEAELEYRQALALREKLVADDPASAGHRKDLATSHSNLGAFLRESGRNAEAAREFRKALALQDRLVSEFLAVPEYRRALAHSHHNLGVVLCKLDRRSDAEKEFREAVTLWKQLAAEFVHMPECHLSLAQIFQDMGLGAEAAEEYGQALALQEKQVADFPHVPDYRRELAKTHQTRGMVLRGLQRADEARDEFQKALALQK
jgi:serine/threonine protein kinase/Flp pilus assembly protein TadD